MNIRLDSPIVDHRDYDQLIEQMRQLAPYYTPEWRFQPDQPDPGAALFMLFARLLEGNIRRLNRMPYKSLLAFLNRFHIPLLPARPALAQVRFVLTEGATESVFIPKGTSLAATTSDDPDPILFETAKAMLVSTANLMDVFSVSPRRDRIVCLASEEQAIHPGEANQGVALFGSEGDNLQEHAFFLCHNDLFLLNHQAQIELTIMNSTNEFALPEIIQLLTNTAFVNWEYHSEGEWKPFDRVMGNGSSVILLKRKHIPITPTSCFQTYGYWIRCLAKSLSEENGSSRLGTIQLDKMLIKSDFLSSRSIDGIVPDRLYFNDIQLDTEQFMPYGDFFTQYGLFYIANREALSKRGAMITLQYQLSFVPNRLFPERPLEIQWKLIMKRREVDKTEIPDPVTISNVLWEYWNGYAWVKLAVTEEAQTMFGQPVEETTPREISFLCPDDLSSLAVNSEENFWIRGRILAIENAYSANAVYFSPRMERFRLRFAYEKPMHPPMQMWAQNNLIQRDVTNEVRSGGILFRPFQPLSGSHPALWFGFDQPPERGPVHLYFSLRNRRVLEADIPLIEWEYLRKNGDSLTWSPLAAADDTQGFTRSGTLQFVGPRDFAHAAYFGVQRYWIRAINRDRRLDLDELASESPRALGMSMNTTLVIQQETIKDEYPLRVETLDPLEERMQEGVQLSRTPVLTEEIWVDETDTLSEEAIHNLKQSGIVIQEIRDSDHQLLRCWVQYKHVEHFLASTPEDRHYTIDRAVGRIEFGNGRWGKTPPHSGDDKIRVTYATGGGRRGNVAAHSIVSMQESIAYIDRVIHLEAASGGCDLGEVDEAVIRGPKRLIHLQRAVTAEDFEWLAREAHPNVAKVKCLPHRNAKLQYEPGAISVVVLPKSGIGNGAHFLELKRDIEQQLLKQAASHVAFPGRVQVIEPALLATGVNATLWVRHMDDIVPVEREVLSRLNIFLDPITGNTQGQGWEIGQTIHPSMFYALLKSVGSVFHIPQLALQLIALDDGAQQEITLDQMVQFPHGIVTPGEHRIVVEIGK